LEIDRQKFSHAAERNGDGQVSGAKEPTAAALKDAENAVFMLEMLGGEHDRHGLHYSVIEETVVERDFTGARCPPATRSPGSARRSG
jgi:hypothetical protein